MGANISTVEDSRASVAPPHAATSHAVFSPTYHHNYKPSVNNNRSAYPEIRVPHEVKSGTSFSPNYSHKSYSGHHHNRSNIPPAAALVPSSKAGQAHRVIYFHSSASCRGYLEASKASNSLIVLDFTNGWSGRCRYMEPTLHEFAAKYTNVEFLKIDVDELSEVSQEYGVQTTPTFVLMKRGKVIDKVVGANKEEFQSKIEKHRGFVYY